eukprot:TRINITY_DN1809_c0_g1_i1.p1 TRINITY_DN1809_c0_g1~~TRINITY_DN1809_c0_g1_i1.p1  ORF type:complete len:276 (+),score=67.39 TRINITY_DN1809_c0_g1_i1:158-985(+)
MNKALAIGLVVSLAVVLSVVIDVFYLKLVFRGQTGLPGGSRVIDQPAVRTSPLGVDFSGARGHFWRPAAATSRLTGLTISAWVFSRMIRPHPQLVVHNGDAASDGVGLVLSSSDNRIGVLYGNVSFMWPPPVANSSGSRLPTGAWHFVSAVSAVPDSWQLFRDSVAVGTLQAPRPATRPSALLTVGGQSRQLYNFDGKIGSVQIWQLARSPAQLRADAGFALTGSEARLLLYVPFAERTGRQAMSYGLSATGGALEARGAFNWTHSSNETLVTAL